MCKLVGALAIFISKNIGLLVQFKPLNKPRLAQTSKHSPNINWDNTVAVSPPVFQEYSCVEPTSKVWPFPPADRRQYKEGGIELVKWVELNDPTAICVSL